MLMSPPSLLPAPPAWLLRGGAREPRHRMTETWGEAITPDVTFLLLCCNVSGICDATEMGPSSSTRVMDTVLGSRPAGVGLPTRSPCPLLVH